MGDTGVYELSQVGDRLWGRARGKEVRLEIESRLETVQDGGILKVELENVEVMDFSFSSEVFGRLIGAIPTSFPNRSLVLANPSEYVTENLNAALEPLDLMAFVTNGAGQWKLIGKFAETDIRTLEVLAELEKATASEVADELGIKLTTSNQRLRKLVDSGVITRYRTTSGTGGTQYVYLWPQ